MKVKPEERLTIEGVLDHPWLNSTEALDNVLPSAQLMMDKVLNDAYFFHQKAVLRRNAGTRLREGSEAEQYKELSLSQRDIHAFLKIRF